MTERSRSLIVSFKTEDRHAAESEMTRDSSGQRHGDEPESLHFSIETILEIDDKQTGLEKTMSDTSVDNASERKRWWFSRNPRNSKEHKASNHSLRRTASKHLKTGLKKTHKSIKNWSKEFGLFLGDGRIMDYAIGMVVGTSFITVINSFVNDLLSPFIGLAIGRQLENFYVVLKAPDATVCARNATMCNFKTPADAHTAGAVTWNLGSFLQILLNFFMIALTLFSVIRFLKTFILSTKQSLKNLKNSGMATPLFKKRDPSRPSTGEDRPLSTGSTPAIAHKADRNSDALSSGLYGLAAMRKSASDAGLPSGASWNHNQSSIKPHTASTEVSNSHTILVAEVGASPAAIKHKNLSTYFGAEPGDHMKDLKECAYCLSHIPTKASRCAHCTAVLEVVQSTAKPNHDPKNVKFDLNFSSIPFHI